MLHFTCDRCKRPIDTDNELRYSIQVRVEVCMGCYRSPSQEDVDPLDQVAEGKQDWVSLMRQFTGEFYPVLDKAKCIDCLQCWVFCPDGAILVEDEKMAGFDYGHCKGCGICAHLCPVGAIEMIPEEKVAEIEIDEWGIRKSPPDESGGKS